MEEHDYIVTDIQGDYAFLQQTDADGAEPFQVALALLPPETDTGTRLRGVLYLGERLTVSDGRGRIRFIFLCRQGTGADTECRKYYDDYGKDFISHILYPKTLHLKITYMKVFGKFMGGFLILDLA